ncbi:hypothetical protein [Planctomycetes bacterium K23_9]
MTRIPQDNDPLNPYRADPFEVPRDRFGSRPEHEAAQFDPGDGRWVWVRMGILSLMFGYFCIPIFIVAAGVVTRMEDAGLMQAVLYVGVSATLIPIALGWSLCGLTPPEVGTRKFAIIVAVAILAQIWIAMGRLWPDVIDVPQLLTRFRSLISLVAISCMLRYLQGTFEYLRPGHRDTWALKLQKLTNWLTYALIGGVFFILAVGMPPQAVLVPILAIVFFALLAMMILFWGCLFRLWFLLRGEGQFQSESY